MTHNEPAEIVKLTVKRSKKDKNPVTVFYHFGNDIDDAIKLFDGELALDKVVFPLFLAAARQQLSNFVRRLATTEDPETKKPRTPEAIQAAVDAWRPGERSRAKAGVERVVGAVREMTPEQREALRRQLETLDAGGF